MIVFFLLEITRLYNSLVVAVFLGWYLQGIYSVDEDRSMGNSIDIGIKTIRRHASEMGYTENRSDYRVSSTV